MRKKRGVENLIIAMMAMGLCACATSENSVETADKADSGIALSTEVVKYSTPILTDDFIEHDTKIAVNDVPEGLGENENSANESSENLSESEITANESSEDLVETEAQENATSGFIEGVDIISAGAESSEAESSGESSDAASGAASSGTELSEATSPENESSDVASSDTEPSSEENNTIAQSPSSAEAENIQEETVDAVVEEIIEAEKEGTENIDTSEVVNASGPMFASYDLQTLQNMNYSEEQMQQISAFYEGSVFAGDSVLLGFRNYSGKSSDPMLKQIQFLAAGSLSLHNSFWPVSDKSVHPLYQGAQHPVWESIQMMGAKKAFLFFGINDVSSNMDESVGLYPQLVDKIKELSPDTEINIISATYTLKDKGKGKLNNANLATFNSRVQELAAQNGWGYLDIANVLSDGAGNLAEQYCSDGFLHESNKAYDVWRLVLIRYAAQRLGLQETNQ